MAHHVSKLNIDRETRLKLEKLEYWHFLSIQIRWVTIVTFMISLIEVATFLLAFYSMDFKKVLDKDVPEFIKKFRFYCIEGSPSRWETEVTPLAEILFTMHVIIIFMYSTINLMVLSSIPFKYNRFAKTEKEIEIDREKREKRKARKMKKQQQVSI